MSSILQREKPEILSVTYTPPTYQRVRSSKVLQPLHPLTCSPAPNASVQPTQMCELSWETAALCVGWRWRWPHWWAWWSGSLQRSKEWWHQLAQSRHNQPAFLPICTHLPGCPPTGIYRAPHPHAASNSHLMDSHSVDIRVIHKPDNLVGKELTIVLRGQIGLSGLRWIKLQPFTDPFT